jgi:hypothetical protein
MLVVREHLDRADRDLRQCPIGAEQSYVAYLRRELMALSSRMERAADDDGSLPGDAAELASRIAVYASETARAAIRHDRRTRSGESSA